ncbi:MAG: amidohydrolase family protein [Verrucomicrobiota bacterium]
MMFERTNVFRWLVVIHVLGLPMIGQAVPNKPGPPQRTPILLKDVTLHTVSGEVIEDGQLLFNEGKIQNLGDGSLRINLEEDTEILSLEGHHVYPGMIAANSVMGLVEIRAVRATVDVAEPGTLNPNARAEVSFNPDSEIIPVTRANGVLSAMSIPQTRGLISGQSALMALDGWTWESMTIKQSVGMHLFWPGMRFLSSTNASKEARDNLKKQKKEGAKRLRDLKSFFDRARAYGARKKEKKEGARTDLRLEAMLPVLDRKVPLFIHANTLPQIESALSFVSEQKVRMVLVGGQDAWRAAPLLKAQEVPVILSPVQSLPLRRWEPHDTPFTNALKLHEAGVLFCIANGGSTFQVANERNLPYQAGAAAAFGLPREEALKSVTLYPARILGVEDRLGSLEEGKDATFFISDGDPLETRTRILQAFIQGREVDLSSKHTRLYDKYREKYWQLESRE